MALTGLQHSDVGMYLTVITTLTLNKVLSMEFSHMLSAREAHAWPFYEMTLASYGPTFITWPMNTTCMVVNL
jgi:hypothetical protein